MGGGGGGDGPLLKRWVLCEGLVGCRVCVWMLASVCGAWCVVVLRCDAVEVDVARDWRLHGLKAAHRGPAMQRFATVTSPEIAVRGSR